MFTNLYVQYCKSNGKMEPVFLTGQVALRSRLGGATLFRLRHQIKDQEIVAFENKILLKFELFTFLDLTCNSL